MSDGVSPLARRLRSAASCGKGSDPAQRQATITDMLFKLRLRAVDPAAGQAAAAIIGELVPEPLAVTLFEDAPPAFVVEAYFDREPLPERIADALAGLGTAVDRPTLEPVPDVNWVALSQASLPPVRAGRFVVHGSHDRRLLGVRRMAIEIEAGEAFGTGHGATTALCLEAIDRLARQGWRCSRAIDLGCGSGVLAIAAARAFAGARVLAVDNDPVATAVARHNVRLNRTGARVRVIDASGFAHARLRGTGTFDLVLANLLPGPLLSLAPQVRAALRPGGIAVLSGLLATQAREIRAAYCAAGFRLLQQRHRDGWSALVLARGR